MRTTIVKKIAAIGTGLAFVGATMMGALAVDLNDYPGSFLKDSKFNAAIVVGDQAAASDVVGAIDLAASLQFAAREEKTVAVGGTDTVSASDGVEVAATGNHLELLETMSSVEDAFKNDDLPVLLADGKVEDDSTGTDYEYDQELQPSADFVEFDNPDDDVFGDNPGLFLNQDTGVAYTIVVDFDSVINVSALDDSEKIVMMGRTFTFDPDMESDSTYLTLYASEKTETLSVGEEKTITLADGTSIVVELTGANSESDKATLRVDGKSYSKESGDTISIGDTSLYINNVFTYNIPAPGAAVEFFVGSDKLEINADGGAADDVVIDDETMTGIAADIDGTLEELEQINFQITPSEFDDDHFKYLQLGEEFVDPLFGTFKMKFAGVTPELKDESKSKISLTRAGNDYKLAFVNKDAEAYEFELFSSVSGSAAVTYHEDFAGATDNVSDDNIFILEEGDVAKVFRLVSVVNNDGLKANIRDLTDNKDFTVSVGDDIGDSSATVLGLDATVDYMELDENTILDFTTQFDGNLVIGDPTDTNIFDLIFKEGTTNFDDLSITTEDTWFMVNVSGDNSDASEDITLTRINSSTGLVEIKADEDTDVEYGVSVFGTYYEYEKDNNGAYWDIYYPETEQDMHVFFMPLEATTSTSAGGEAVTYYEYNRIEVGAAKLASEITSVVAQNLIVVGGPCANSVASQLLDNPANCAEGFEEGKAILKLVENGEYVALLVAGYSADDTRRATAVLANYEDYALAGMEMVVTGTSLTDITVSAPQ